MEIFESKKYEIGGKYYIQRPIVLAQLELLEPVIGAVGFKIDSAHEVAHILGAQLPEGLAVVLIPSGENLKEACRPEQLAQRVEELKWNMHPEKALEVIEDFFSCNLSSTLLERLGEMVKRLAEQAKKSLSGLNPLSTPLAEVTSPSETQSSGEPKQDEPSSGSISERESNEKSSLSS